MSNDSPVKGFRKLGDKNNQPPEPAANPWEAPAQHPAPFDPFSQPPAPPPAPSQPYQPPAWPQNPPSNSPATIPWNDVSPQLPGRSNVPNPPPPPPWQQAAPSAQGYASPPQNNATPAYPPQGYGYQPMGPNPSTAYIIELLGGLFGLFGLGYMYAGKTGDGATRLIVGIVCNIVVGISAAFSGGICACIALPAYLVVAILSADAVKKMLLNP